MTTYSRSDLATRVLKDAGLVDITEAPDADNLAWVTETIESGTAYLQRKGITIWNGSDQALPHEYLAVIARWFVLFINPSYGFSDPAQAILAMREVEKDLLVMTARPPTGQVMEAEHF
jgi:hypothetical protein